MHSTRVPGQLRVSWRVPGWRLHPLKGEHAGFWSIWVDASWRLTFRFAGVDIELVDYTDDH